MQELKTFSYTFSGTGFEKVLAGKFRSYLGIQNRTGFDIYVCIGQSGSDVTEANSVIMPCQNTIWELFAGVNQDVYIKVKEAGLSVVLVTTGD